MDSKLFETNLKKRKFINIPLSFGEARCWKSAICLQIAEQTAQNCPGHFKKMSQYRGYVQLNSRQSIKTQFLSLGWHFLTDLRPNWYMNKHARLKTALKLSFYLHILVPIQS